MVKRHVFGRDILLLSTTEGCTPAEDARVLVIKGKKRSLEERWVDLRVVSSGGIRTNLMLQNIVSSY